MTDRLHFCHKFFNAPHFFSLFVDKRMKDVEYTKSLMNIYHKTTLELVYIFKLCIDYNVSKFNFSHFFSTLQNFIYEPLLHSLENQVDKGISGSY